MAAEAIRFALSYEALTQWCQRQGYQFTENAELKQLAVHYQLLAQPAPLMILPQPERDMVMFVMRQPYTVPPERRTALIDAVALLNASSFMGAWVQNRRTGELYFRATLPVGDIQYTDAGVLMVARVVVGTSERAAPALRTIALGGGDPAESLAGLVS